MITKQEVTTSQTSTVYRTAAPDTSSIVATVIDTAVTVTYGGTSLSMPVDALSALTALTATIAAAIEPVQPETAPTQPA